MDEKYPVNDQGVPDKIHCQRHAEASYYFAYDTAKSFDKLYNPKSYFNQKFSKYWQKIA